MSSNINITATNFQVLTGNTVAVTRRQVTLGETWTDDAGVNQVAAPHVVTFPDILVNAALPNGWLQQKLTQLVLDADRIIQGIDQPQ